MLMFALPMLAGTALQVAHSVINAIWVGQFLGESALAAVQVSVPVVFVLIAAGAGLTLATNILVSQRYGRGDMAGVRMAVRTSTTLVAVAALALLIAGQLAAGPILLAMQTPPDLLPIAANYLRIFLLSLPLWFCMFLTRSMLQGIGDSRTPLYFQAMGVLLNAGLDPVLMLGLGPIPAMGLNGTAWATLIAQSLAVTSLIVLLRRRNNLVAPRLGLKRFDWATAGLTIKLGLPSAVQQAFISMSMVFVTGVINGFGQSAIAAYGVSSRVDQLLFMPAMTFSLAIATLTGQHIGAGKLERIRAIFGWGCVLSGGVTLAGSILVVTLPELVLRMFTPEAEVIRLGSQYLRIVGVCYIFFAFMFVSNGIINGSGHTLVATVITIVALWGVRVPVAYLVARPLHDLHIVWYAIAASFGVSMTLSLLYYLSGRWKQAVDPTAPLRTAVAQTPKG